MPERVQIRRDRPWQREPKAIKVDRTTRWGNPFRIGDTHRVTQGGAPAGEAVLDRAATVWLFRTALEDGLLPFDPADVLEALAGRDLACWCPLTDVDGRRVPCHADVLLAIANPEPVRLFPVPNQEGPSS